ncbi:uncharacterized protein LOC116300342, partial [Actinia tenebrosa]|uniref:Uncharacterized protein LOC116300342 n=1 Tax=Actinia tenebrosa TaxID=6105 RepID=A0A6P8IC61_ACTTE
MWKHNLCRILSSITHDSWRSIIKILTVVLNPVFCEDDVPEPVGLFPLNSLHTTKDISNSYLTAGIAVGVSLAPGPDDKPGGSYYFPGSPGSYIDIPKQPKLDTRYSISIFAWIYNQGTAGPIIIYATGTSQYALHMFINIEPANFFFRLTGRAFTSNTALTYNLVTVNNWRYVGYTYDYNTGLQRLYVDGVKVREGIVPKQEIATNHKVRIGGNKQGDGRVFKGRISCVQIYDKALTQAQVLAVKNRCQYKNELYSACLQHISLNDPTRAVEYKVRSQPADRQTLVRRRWYRLKSEAGTRII